MSNLNWYYQYELMILQNYISCSVHRKGPRRNDIPVAMSVPHAQNLLSDYHSPLKETKMLWINS